MGEPVITDLGITGKIGIWYNRIQYNGIGYNITGIRYNGNGYNGIGYNITGIRYNRNGYNGIGYNMKQESDITYNTKVTNLESDITETGITESGIT